MIVCYVPDLWPKPQSTIPSSRPSIIYYHAKHLLKMNALKIQGQGNKRETWESVYTLIGKGPFYVLSSLRRRVRVRRMSFLYFFFFIRSLR
jgi:hypothetical protein